MNSALIADWKNTVGLTINRIEEYLTNEYDEEKTYTMIFFTNEKFLIQKDQSGHGPTNSGLADQDNYIKWLLDISAPKTKHL